MIAECDDVAFGSQFDSVFASRRRECDEFYAQVLLCSRDTLLGSHHLDIFAACWLTRLQFIY